MEDQIKEAGNVKSISSWLGMKHLKKWLKEGLIFCFFSLLVLLSSSNKIFAEETNWTEVANTTNEIQFIDTKSIKYNNRGILSVLTKYSEINPDDQANMNTNIYLMAIDCDNRLFSKLPVNGELNQVREWKTPINDKLIKKTIINSCSY